MNGLTKQERNYANCFHVLNRKFVREIFRITNNSIVNVKIKCFISSNRESISIYDYNDYFVIKVTFMQSRNNVRTMIDINSTISMGIDENTYQSYSKIRNEISDFCFKKIGI